MDYFRKKHRKLNDDEQRSIDNLKELAGIAYAKINECEIDCQSKGISGRRAQMFSKAKEKMEEAVMWAVKAITE